MGHDSGEDGMLALTQPWKGTRGNNPGGGIVSSAVDRLRWARFHLGDGRAEGGVRVLPAELLHRMQEPTVALRAGTLGDASGIGWFLRDVDGARTVGHGGSANGQFAELLTVPERDFAVVAFSNDGPDGIPFNQAVVRWTPRTYLGVTDRDPEPLPHDRKRAAKIVGRYESDAMTLTIGEEAAGLRLEVLIEPEIRAAADSGLPPTTRRSISASCPAKRTSTSSPTAPSRAGAASSPAPGAARSCASTLPAGCSRGGRDPAGPFTSCRWSPKAWPRRSRSPRPLRPPGTGPAAPCPRRS
ncbi:serine hydrolase domain-containing protein [Streptomyces sp. LN785]|uniref:serine hydrolase domain-containing protein n=1 Tax=Streptomyces sp. LN785 TaxID=3112983 RepID=UPI0037109131